MRAQFLNCLNPHPIHPCKSAFICVFPLNDDSTLGVAVCVSTPSDIQIYRETAQPNRFSIGLPLSTSLIGRPMLLMFSLDASIFRPWQIEWNRSGTLIGRS